MYAEPNQDDAATTCRSAAADEMMTAVQLILGGGNGRLADEPAAVEFMRFAAERGASLARLWVAVAGGRIAWAGLPFPSPGRTASIAGTPVDAGNAAAAARGIATLGDRLTNDGVQLVQTMLDPSLAGTIAAYAGQGFAAVAELIYLSRSIRRAPEPPPLPAGFAAVEYGPETHAVFGAAILASYEQSLDCPALNGVRDVEDVIAGHKAVGPFDPADWTLVLDRAGGPAAVLLLSRVGREGMELVYLGVVPAARNHGLGDHLMRVAARRVADLKQRRLSLAVDSANGPALRLYHRHGFEEVGRKVAMMRRSD